MNEAALCFEQLVQSLLDPVTTRQLAKRFEQIRQAALDQLREAGCPADLLDQAETACLKHQRDLDLILAAHAERLEAWQEYRPELFQVFRQQFGALPIPTPNQRDVLEN